MPPALLKTSPPKPGKRIFNPLISSSELISLLNQPNIWVPVLPPGKGFKLNGRYRSSQSSSPPPLLTQALISSAVKPKGTPAKNCAAGTFPFQ